MTNDEIYERLTTVFEDVFDEPIVLTPELTAAEVEDWDSMNHIRLLLTIERKFGIKFSTSEIGGLKNVGDLVALIQKAKA